MTATSGTLVIVVALAATFSTAACAPEDPDVQDGAPLEVYAAVLRHTVLAEGFGGTAEGPDVQVPLERLVILRETDRLDGRLPQLMTSLLPGLDSATLADFNAPREDGGAIDSIPGVGPHHVVANDSISNVLEGGWRSFYRVFPASAGLVAFSHVGFGTGGDRALVYMEHTRNGEWGHGTAYLLERTDGRWTVVDEKRLMDV